MTTSTEFATSHGSSLKAGRKQMRRWVLMLALSGGLMFGGAGMAQANPRGDFSPAVASAMNECNLITVGTQGTCVQTVQRTLNSAQNANLVVDGQFGLATRSATIRFQLAHGLVADGVVGDQTKWAIRVEIQTHLDSLDKGAAEPGLNSPWVDTFCSILGTAPGLVCSILTH